MAPPSPSAVRPRSPTRATGETHTWTIVGVTEADRAAGKLSAESPVAKALMDQPAGTVVSVQTPKGTRRLRIERVL